MKGSGKPDDRKGHVRFDVAGAGNGFTVRLVRHRQTKETEQIGFTTEHRASPRPYIMAVSGERIVPPIIAAMPMSAHSPLSPTGMNFAEAAPSAPPIISNGASTPPDVPDPSAKDQTSDFPIRIPRRAGPTTSPLNSSWIVSYPTPSTRGSTIPPIPTNKPPIAGHHN